MGRIEIQEAEAKQPSCRSNDEPDALAPVARNGASADAENVNAAGAVENAGPDTARAHSGRCD